MLLQAAGWAGTAVDGSSTERSGREGTLTARHGGGTAERPQHSRDETKRFCRGGP